MSCGDNADRFHRLVAQLHGRVENERP
jgi:hypothetical protein